MSQTPQVDSPPPTEPGVGATQIPSRRGGADRDIIELTPALDRDRHAGRRPPASLAPGRTIGRYIILGELGSGGMGRVVRAYDEALDRAVAIKLLHPDAAQRHAHRLRREAQALARLSHPNVVHVYEIGQDEQWFIAMELVHGQTLRQWHKSARPWPQLVRMYIQAGEGLSAAHAAGLVHRDFKPDNCIVDDEGRARVMDFGLVRETDIPSQVDSEGSAGLAEALDGNWTRTGSVLGTPAYMPLEQLNGETSDARSDQFSFCVSLYEALYGERPFAANTVATLTAALIKQRIQAPPRGTKVPAKLRRVILRGLSSDPQQRWPSMQALLSELRRVATPRRLGRRLAFIGAAAAAVGFAAWSRPEPEPEPEPPCRGASAQLADTWNEDRRGAVERAFSETGVPFAADTMTRVSPLLDEYARTWIDEHTDACEATNVRQEQSSQVMDLRMACLHDRREQLDSVVDLLSRANATRIEKSVELVTALPPIDRCSDIDALQAQLPQPDDPRVEASVQRLRRQLMQLSVMLSAGEPPSDSQAIDELLEDAQQLGYRPLLAEVWYSRGWLATNQGRYDDAEEDLERAHLLALELGHEQVATQSASRLAFLTGYHRGRHAQAAQWGKTALALSHKLGNGLILADTLNSHGVILALLEQLEEAEALHRRALELRTNLLSPHHPSLASSLAKIGDVQMKQGRYDEALDYFERAMTLREQAFGPQHPEVARGHNQVGNIAFFHGRYEHALERYRQAIEIAEATIGPDHPFMGSALFNSANALLYLGQPERALEYYERALAIQTEKLGTEHPKRASTLDSMGFALSKQQRYEAAVERYREALAIRRKVHEPLHRATATTLSNLGRVLVQMGRIDEAETTLERAHDIRKQVLPPAHPDLAWSLIGLAQVRLAKGDGAMARRHAERALEIREQAGASADLRAEAQYVLATVLWEEPEQRSRARQLAQQARRTYADLNAGFSAERRDIDAWLRAHPGRRPTDDDAKPL